MTGAVRCAKFTNITLQRKRDGWRAVSCFDRSVVMSQTGRSIFDTLRLTLRAQSRSVGRWKEKPRSSLPERGG
jgi:hypothetical protein